MEIFNRWSGSAHNVSFRYDGFYSFPGNPIKPRYGRLSVGRARRVDPGPGLKFRFYRFRVLKFFYYRVQVRVRKYSINRVRVQKSWTRRALVPGNTYYQRVSLNIFPIPLVPGFNRKPHLIQLYYNIKPKLIFELICLGCTFIRWLWECSYRWYSYDTSRFQWSLVIYSSRNNSTNTTKTLCWLF
jgi:hypothetical protein